MLSWLANRTALFIGFSLSDRDFLELLMYLKNALRKYMPPSFAVMKDVEFFKKEFLEKYGVSVIISDALDFLDKLAERIAILRLQTREDIEPWMRNKFFRELLQIRSLPTETQVIDALLNEIKHQIEHDFKLENLQEQVNEAVQLVLRYRPNYSALEKLHQELLEMFSKCRQEDIDLWDEFLKLENKRKQIEDRINAKASQIIDDARSILLYSQSKRVGNCLLSLSPSLQKEITLYIAECRPKSPKPFQDAIATARMLKDTYYQIRLIPEASALHLLKNRQFDLVLMGAHSVFKDAKTGQYIYFVNTCGSEAIVEIANIVNIPVKVIFELDKVILLSDKSQLKRVMYEEEENIGSDVLNELASIPQLSERIRVINIGYDLVEWRTNVYAVTDE
jgi:translation initiation factor 2B subunit (eIF-2B alpha/beta/delta family)